MATRATVNQRMQIGLESAPGTAVAASRLLQSLAVTLNPDTESTPFRPRGGKYATVVAVNRESSTGDLEGTPTYDEVVYPLSGVFGKPQPPVQIMNGETGTGAYLWTFETGNYVPDDPATFTVEQGDSTMAERVAFVTFTDFGLSFSRDEVGVSGSVIGQAIERGLALTTTPTTVGSGALVPIQPAQVCVYVSDSVAALGGPESHIPTAVSVEPSIGGKYGAAWFLNCLQSGGFGAIVEQAEPDFSVDLLVEANASGLQWADLFRSGATRYLRVEARGPRIDPDVAGSEYRLTWDMAVKVREPGEYSDEDGVYALGPTLEVVHDATMGAASRVEVVNTVSSL